jgi:exodeoxyribonuclease V alpha subunit
VSAFTSLDQLDAWVEAGWLRDVDRAFAAFLAREAPDAHPLLLLAAALASHQLGRSHVCLDLRAVLADAGEALALPPEDVEDQKARQAPVELLAGLRLADWRAALQHPALVGEGPGNTPLVLQGDRLYLRRYWQHERTVRESIAARLAQPPLPEGADEARLRSALDALFGRAEDLFAEVDWQKVACALAARSRFSIITGGPGTGKTTTVVRLLAVLQHLALAHGRPLRIRLAAPTGKAAARLNDSISRAVDALPPDLRAEIPTAVTTVHRLLGSRPDTRHFIHHARNPLPVDVLVLDEASMVDLEMMAAVLTALPPTARLVLLGDKDQLASVEAGAVLGELCSRADAGHYLPPTRDWLRSVTGDTLPDEIVDPAGQPLDQAVVKLRRSYRFGDASGIGRLAKAVNAGDVTAMRELSAARLPDLAFALLGEGDDDLRDLVLGSGGYGHYLGVMHAGRPPAGAAQDALDAWARAVLQAFADFQLLAAVRKGPAGVEQLNERVAKLLHAAGLTPDDHGWTPGRPVMVTRNDYALGLMNGDVGITLEVPGADACLLRVAFTGAEGHIRWVLPSRLQAVETAYAMTVHKAQGSEFGHAALLLPPRMNRVLTRELIYTAVTRAKSRLTLASMGGSTQVLEEAVMRSLQRGGS